MDDYEIAFDDFEEFCVWLLKDPYCWQYVNFKWQENPENLPDHHNFPRASISIRNVGVLATYPGNFFDRVLLDSYRVAIVDLIDLD